MNLERILVVTGDHSLPDPTKWDGGYSEDDLQLHRTMVAALRSLGRFEVDVCSEHAQLLARLRDDPPQLVVNLCDTGFGNRAALELHIPALLEILEIPYTGAPPAAMVIAYDKALVSLLAGSVGVPVPREWVVPAGSRVAPPGVVYPAFVKPAAADGSVGIDRNSCVADEAALVRQLAWLAELRPEAAVLVQEYLPGAEYGLALLGNPGQLRALPPLQIDYSALPADLPPILAFESKTGPETPYERVGIQRAALSPETLADLTGWATVLFERIGFRDYARFDFRTAADGTIRLLEVNPNPAWSCEAKLARMAAFEGLAYPELLQTLIDAAWTRATLAK